MIQEKEVCLVIGGEGFLGRHLVNLLCERRKTQPGLEIRIFDISKRLEWPSEIKFFQGDICSFDDLSAACQGGVTTIFQTASPLPNSSSKVLHKVNVEGMKTVIEVCKALKVKKLIYTSSCSVVYDGSPIRNMNEETPLVINHIEEYSRTKYLGERLVLEANSHTLKTCSLRVSGLFGPGDRQNLPGFLSSLDKGRSSTAIGTNQNLFDFTYIENAAHAHLLAFEKLDNSPNVAGEAFFITNGTPIPFFNNARKFLTFF
ncbi:erg26, C-3 sterol dehydrogenase, partial [Massospora cicadina]